VLLGLLEPRGRARARHGAAPHPPERHARAEQRLRLARADGCIERREQPRGRALAHRAPELELRLLRDLTQHRVAEARDARTPRPPDVADRLVHGGPGRNAVEQQDLIGRDQQVPPHERIGHAARGVRKETFFQAELGSQHAVDELGQERAVAGVELWVAIELGVQGGRGVRAVAFDPLEHAHREPPHGQTFRGVIFTHPEKPARSPMMASQRFSMSFLKASTISPNRIAMPTM
jgi:hypothetical protein